MSELSEPCVPSTQVEINGFTWTIYATTTAETIDLIVKVSKALTRRGYSAPKRPAFGGLKPQSKPLTQPLYRDDGTPCCPIHHNRNGQPTPVRFVAGKDGRPGFWGCPARSDSSPGETVNQNGYCDLRFSLPDPEPAPTNGAHAR
jgi:hypothetical protein